MFYRVPFLCGDGVPTDDGRIFTAITWRDLPLPLAFQTDTQHANLATSDVVGQLVAIEKATDGTNSAIIEVDPRDDNGRAIHEEGARAAQMIEQGGQGISIDGLLPVDAKITEECVSEGDDGWCLSAIYTFSEVIIGGATLTPIPAYGQAIVDPRPVDADGRYLDETESVEMTLVASAAMAEVPSLIASSGLGLTAGAAVALAEWAPQAHHFAAPVLTPEANYINLDDDGRLWGWVAPAERCHQGIPGQCVLAANESPDLSDFLRNRRTFGEWTGYVGFLTMDTGHQDFSEPAAKSPAHYDDTTKIVAIVTAGIVPEGEYSAGSVWFAGSVNPTLSTWQREVLLSAQASGDWRGDPGDRVRTLRAALVVPVPGFLRKREPVLASGAPCSCRGAEVDLPAAVVREMWGQAWPIVASATSTTNGTTTRGCTCGSSHSEAAALPDLTAAQVAELAEFLNERSDARLAQLDEAMPDPLEALDSVMGAS